MTSFLTSFSVALLMTLIFVFRFSMEKNPVRVALYFCLFFILKWVLDVYALPPGAFGIEIAYVCFVLSGLFALCIFIRARFGTRED